MIRRCWYLPLVLLVTVTAGCGGCNNGATPDEGKKPFVLGDLVEAFDPPTLKELDAKVEWVAMPVLDSWKIQQEILRLEGKPELTPKEALKLLEEIQQDGIHF